MQPDTLQFLCTNVAGLESTQDIFAKESNCNRTDLLSFILIGFLNAYTFNIWAWEHLHGSGGLCRESYLFL